MGTLSIDTCPRCSPSACPHDIQKKNACAAQTGLLALALLLGCDFADGLDGAGGKKATDAAITNMP